MVRTALATLCHVRFYGVCFRVYFGCFGVVLCVFVGVESTSVEPSARIGHLLGNERTWKREKRADKG